jgi:hypothetical protein
MASQKISQLTAITTVASGDYFPIVEASGTTNKRVEVGVLDARYYSVASGDLTYILADSAGQLATTALASGNAAQNTANNALASGLIALQTSDIGVTVQAYDADTAKLDVVQTFTAVQTFTDPAISGTIAEDVYTITDGAAFEVDPSNGSVQLITLGASRTPKATNFAAGESITLMVDDGSAYTLTWTDSTWGTGGVTWVGGDAPELATSGYSVIQFWKVGTKVYGAYVGDVA